jgi:hypothetical protein
MNVRSDDCLPFAFLQSFSKTAGFFIVCALLFFPNLSLAEETFQIRNEVVIDRTKSLPAETICHDGTYIYQKNLHGCLQDGSCEEARLAPIREIERISLNDVDHLTRFHRIDLSFEINTYERIALNTDSDLFIYTLIDTQYGEVEYCHDVAAEHMNPEVIYSQRIPSSSEEQRFLEDLHHSGYQVINALAGPLLNFQQVNIESPDIDRFNIAPEYLERNISSPLCDPNISQDIIHLMGGEFSGNGILQPAFDSLVSASTEISPIFSDTTRNSPNFITCTPPGRDI